MKPAQKTSLNTIEDGKDFNIKLSKVAKFAGVNATAEAQVLKIPVTYLKGNKIIKENPDGKIKVLSKITLKSKKGRFTKGTILHAKQDR